MKIVIATPFYPPAIGVLASYAAGLEKAFIDEGHDVQIVVSRALPLGVRHIEHFFRILVALRGAGMLLTLDTWTVGVPALLAATLTRVPLVARIGGDALWEAYVERTESSVRLSDFYSHTDLSRKERLMRTAHHALLRRARLVFFNTTFQKEIWENAYPALKGKAMLLENYYPPHVETHVPEGRSFVSANRATAYKNGAMLERAFARVKERHPDIELDMRLVPHQEHLARIARSYAVVIPSISEVGSNIAIESVMRGRPFIMTEDCGTKERLSECGLFVDTRSESALEEAIESMLKHDTYERLAANARAFSFTRDWDAIARDILRQV